MNNTTGSSTVNDPCFNAGNDPEYLFLKNVGWYIYTMIMVMYTFGLSGNVISVLAFHKQAKINQSYYHQLSIMISDMISMIVHVIAFVGYVYLGVYDHTAPDFVQKSYLLLLFHWAWTFGDMAQTSNLLLLNCTCIDRLYALHNASKYTKVNQKKVAIVLLAVTHILGFGVNGQKLVIAQLYWDETTESYKVFFNGDVMSHPFVVFLNAFIMILRVGLLISLSIFVILISRKYAKIEKQMRENKNKKARPISEKTLTKLMLIQSGLVILGIMSTCAYETAWRVIMIPWCSPAGIILELIESTTLTIQQSANFLVYIGISKKFREAVRAVFTRQTITEAYSTTAKSVTQSRRWATAVHPLTVGRPGPSGANRGHDTAAEGTLKGLRFSNVVHNAYGKADMKQIYKRQARSNGLVEIG